MSPKVIEDAYEKLDKELLGFVEDVLLKRWGGPGRDGATGLAARTSGQSASPR